MNDRAGLDRAIETLRTEIDTLDPSDEETRAHLQQLANLVESRLHEGERVENPSTADIMMGIVETYEARHPRIIAMANDLMTRLAAMGI